MESRIPLPTDNIYKFYALFGLSLFITCILGTVFISTSTNDKIYELVKESDSFQTIGDSSQKSELQLVIEKRIKIQIENKKFFNKALGIITAVSLVLMVYGFFQWHTKIQPKQDEYFELQIKKLRQEIKESNKTI